MKSTLMMRLFLKDGKKFKPPPFFDKKFAEEFPEGMAESFRQTYRMC